MAYTWEEIKFMADEWWKKVPFKEKVKELLPIAGALIMQGLNKAVPILILIAIKAARLAGMRGFAGLTWPFWWVNLLLVLGWIIGWDLIDIDNIFYAVLCDPKEETCQRVKREIDLRRFKSAWKILQTTEGEREKLPVRNMVTVVALGIVGVWIASSTASILALGAVFALMVRLVWELWQEKNYKRWYWVIKRDFSLIEHRSLVWIMTAVVIYQAVGIIRL